MEHAWSIPSSSHIPRVVWVGVFDGAAVYQPAAIERMRRYMPRTLVLFVRKDTEWLPTLANTTHSYVMNHPTSTHPVKVSKRLATGASKLKMEDKLNFFGKWKTTSIQL